MPPPLTMCSTMDFPSPCPWNSGSTSTSQMVALKAWSDVALARPMRREVEARKGAEGEAGAGPVSIIRVETMNELRRAASTWEGIGGVV